MNRTGIGWCDFTSNPIRARNRETGKVGHFCIHVSEGCENCYAGEWNHTRYGTGLDFIAQNRDKVEMFLHEPALAEILRYKGPAARCFICDMTDLFAEWVPDEWIDHVFATMALQPRLTFQLLTKRPERMRAYLAGQRWLAIEAAGAEQGYYFERRPMYGDWPLPNVWLGVSAENQHWLAQRWPYLEATPAAVRYLSIEPMLGAIDLRLDEMNPAKRPQWIIVGGESGARRRPFDLDWARDVKRQCDEAGVAYFFKQGSAFKPGQPSGDTTLDAAKAWPL